MKSALLTDFKLCKKSLKTRGEGQELITELFLNSEIITARNLAMTLEHPRLKF